MRLSGNVGPGFADLLEKNTSAKTSTGGNTARHSKLALGLRVINYYPIVVIAVWVFLVFGALS
jgi:hypothetical protein